MQDVTSRVTSLYHSRNRNPFTGVRGPFPGQQPYTVWLRGQVIRFEHTIEDAEHRLSLATGVR